MHLGATKSRPSSAGPLDSRSVFTVRRLPRIVDGRLALGDDAAAVPVLATGQRMLTSWLAARTDWTINK